MRIILNHSSMVPIYEQLMEQIKSEIFENKLKEQFSTTVDLASIGELKQDLVASWLADCSMEFRM